MNKHPYTMQEIGEYWAPRIFDIAEELGLRMYPQEFEECDHEQMVDYIAYSGIPSRYPHWSYGKAAEIQRTLYRYGVSGLPYEMVINSNPAIAYLMRDNTLALQILTIAHVAGHNDFFRNNATFHSTDAARTTEMFKVHSRRVRRYLEDPSIGLEKVEKTLDAAHALALQCHRNLAIKKPSRERQLEMIRARHTPRRDEFSHLATRQEFDEKGYLEAIRKVPLEPEEDILLFIRDHKPFAAEWERDLLSIVHEEEQYFLPQIETKIMNEGWASFWHHKILRLMEERKLIDQGLFIEFMVHHNQVVRPHPMGINPYHLGFWIWKELEIWYDGMRGVSFNRPEDEQLFFQMHADFTERGVYTHTGMLGFEGTGEKPGLEKLFQVRETDRDASFLRQFLTPPLIRFANLFEYEPRGDQYVISRVADNDGWKSIRDTLIQNVGMNMIPVIKIEDANFENKRILYLKHYFDGRELLAEYTEKTLGYLQALWEHTVQLDTVKDGKRFAYIIDQDKKLTSKNL